MMETCVGPGNCVTCGVIWNECALYFNAHPSHNTTKSGLGVRLYYFISVPTVTIIGGLVFLLFAVTAFLHDPTQQQESLV